MVGSGWKIYKSKYDIDRIAQSSYGYSDEQLLEQMEIAAVKISDAQIPTASEGDFKRLEVKRKKLEKEKCLENDEIMLKPLLKVATAMAILGSVIVITSVTAGDKKSGECNQKERAATIICSSLS